MYIDGLCQQISNFNSVVPVQTTRRRDQSLDSAIEGITMNLEGYIVRLGVWNGDHGEGVVHH